MYLNGMIYCLIHLLIVGKNYPTPIRLKEERFVLTQFSEDCRKCMVEGLSGGKLLTLWQTGSRESERRSLTAHPATDSSVDYSTDKYSATMIHSLSKSPAFEHMSLWRTF